MTFQTRIHNRAFQDGTRIAADLVAATRARLDAPGAAEDALLGILRDVVLVDDTVEQLRGFIATIHYRLRPPPVAFAEPIAFTDPRASNQRAGMRLAIEVVAGTETGDLAATDSDTPIGAALRKLLAANGVNLPPDVANRLDGFATELQRALALA